MDYIDNYLVVLFKNKKKKRIINKFKTQKRADTFFKSLMDNSNNVLFSKQYENGVKSKYELALVERNSNKSSPLYIRDDLGRNVKVDLDDSNYKIVKIEKYNMDEYILDYTTSLRLTAEQLIKKYLSPSGLKLVYKLNNKIIVQNDDKFNLFTLKNDDDSDRFIDSIGDYFRELKRIDCIFIKDYSTQQRKELYDILIKNGFSKEYLFRHSTTHPTKT
jgi:hypothetical protein